MRFLRKKAIEKNILYTQSIACAFGLAAAAPRSPYRHLELCGIALGAFAVGKTERLRVEKAP